MADRPAHREVPETEFEITPEMIEAGVTVLYESGAVDTPIIDNDRSLVRRIFESMLQAQH